MPHLSPMQTARAIAKLEENWSLAAVARELHCNVLISITKRPNFSQAEKEMIVKVFRGISKDFAELTKTAQMEKTADYTGCGFRTIQ
ncbi:hypothetical protein MTP99_001923 [Tenebrio molitor]|nr:hypothetical protein MTP99_001923 [Tenebrio molitor]